MLYDVITNIDNGRQQRRIDGIGSMRRQPLVQMPDRPGLQPTTGPVEERVTDRLATAEGLW